MRVYNVSPRSRSPFCPRCSHLEIFICVPLASGYLEDDLWEMIPYSVCWVRQLVRVPNLRKLFVRFFIRGDGRRV